MTSLKTDPVCVIIAARDAAATIGTAIGSALAEPEVAEVVVVDDGSSDDTAGVSRMADDGSGRLKIYRLPVNRGPAFARNHAIANSAAPLISILDADDFFLPGRFAFLLRAGDWDLVADDILFVDGDSDGADVSEAHGITMSSYRVDLREFVLGNISNRRAKRGELGFLKPVMRRSFLDRHQLRYQETLRLGEDYDLYVRALLKGARFKVVQACGYCARVRGNSLSGQHRTSDLKMWHEAECKILAMPDLPAEGAPALRAHERQIRARYALREFLDIKTQHGIVAACRCAMQKPATLPMIARGIGADKIEALWGRLNNSGTAKFEDNAPRYLLAGQNGLRK